MSFSVCSNIPGFTDPMFFLSEDPNVLTKKLYDVCQEIRARALEEIDIVFKFPTDVGKAHMVV